MDVGDHNIATESSCGTTGFVISDPLLGSLADNGGSTWAHALLTGSPAIDVGDNTTCWLVDRRGILRPFDGDHVGTATCDIGAYELAFYQYLPLLVKLNINNQEKKEMSGDISFCLGYVQLFGISYNLHIVYMCMEYNPHHGFM